MVNQNELEPNLKEIKKLSDKYPELSIFSETPKEQNDVINEDFTTSRKDDVVLFFSYDIVNSSLYKTINHYSWSIVIDGIISDIRNRVKESVILNDAQVWRVLGDEVIFIIKVHNEEFLLYAIDKIYEILITLCDQLETGKFYDNLSGVSEDIKNVIRLDNIISLQSTAWIATVTNKKALSNNDKSEYIENLYEVIHEKGVTIFHEFIGIDIDTGFRLADDNTKARQLALSFELSYILSNINKSLKYLNIITYRKLKGVWNDQVYPIIWYYNPQYNNDLSFSDSLPFDAVNRDNIYVEYFSHDIYRKEMYKSTKKTFQKIMNDHKLGPKIERMRKSMNSDDYTQLLDSPRLELHCAAVCFDDKGAALVVRRTRRDLLPGKWEVGCSKATSRSNLIECICNEYKNDFNIEIELLMDDDRKDLQPHPIALYSIENEKELHKGIIVVARIKSGKIVLNPKKHSEYKLLTQKQFVELEAKDCVPDLINTLEKAYLYYKERSNNK